MTNGIPNHKTNFRRRFCPASYRPARSAPPALPLMESLMIRLWETPWLTAFVFTLGCLVTNPLIGKAQDPLDRDLAGKAYRAVDPIEGDLKVVGSKSMANLLDHWAERLKKHHPKLKIDLDCNGSETALPELANNKEVLAALSRALSASEIKDLEKKTGREIIMVPVCLNELVLIAHKDNPVKEITLDQLAKAYAFSGNESREAAWGDLGAQGAWAKTPVELQGRDHTSGNRGYIFKFLNLQGDSRERKQKENPSNRAIVEAVGKEKGALGYCPKNLVSKEVKSIRLTSNDGKEPVVLRQPMVLVATREKGKKFPAPFLEYLGLVLSQSGQDGVLLDGFQPLDRAEVLAGLDRVGFSPVK